MSLAQAEWYGNAVTNYAFNDGRLKGFAVGGSARGLEESFPLTNLFEF